MEKQKRIIHGRGDKASSNIHHLVVHLYNPPRNGSRKGSKDFKTTHTFRDVMTYEKAFEIIDDQFAEIKLGGYVSFSPVKKAYYNGKCIILNGVITLN